TCSTLPSNSPWCSQLDCIGIRVCTSLQLLSRLPLSWREASNPAADTPASNRIDRWPGVARVRKLKSLLTNEDGQDLLEYALIIGMLALAGIISLHALSNSAFLGLNGIGNAITSSVSTDHSQLESSTPLTDLAKRCQAPTQWITPQVPEQQANPQSISM